jgi:predicted GIY-YIG superfamily endonuclease
VRLVYVEELPDRKAAMKREIVIKKLKREGKGKLIREARNQYRVIRSNKREKRSISKT